MKSEERGPHPVGLLALSEEVPESQSSFHTVTDKKPLQDSSLQAKRKVLTRSRVAGTLA